jgi:hypothetical protein
MAEPSGVAHHMASECRASGGTGLPTPLITLPNLPLEDQGRSRSSRWRTGAWWSVQLLYFVAVQQRGLSSPIPHPSAFVVVHLRLLLRVLHLGGRLRLRVNCNYGCNYMRLVAISGRHRSGATIPGLAQVVAGTPSPVLVAPVAAPRTPNPLILVARHVPSLTNGSWSGLTSVYAAAVMAAVSRQLASPGGQNRGVKGGSISPTLISPRVPNPTQRRNVERNTGRSMANVGYDRRSPGRGPPSRGS